MAGRFFRFPSIFTRGNLYNIPNQYAFLTVLGEGSFGRVLKCRDKRTKRLVAIKIPTDTVDDDEVSMLRMFKSNGLEKNNIVEFFDSFQSKFGKALVFELLDISLADYFIKTCSAPMFLSDIRAIIQQLATAFDALKRFGVIHADVKQDNIMLVDHQTRPFRVKLIDFGLAISTDEAKLGETRQIISFRSPEILLGLPYSEAIDMWSLGSVMALMISGCLPFEARHEFYALQLIVDLLGQPADDLLDDGIFTELYFIRTESNGWRLKNPQEFGKIPLKYGDNWYCRFPPLDDLKTWRLEKDNKAEAEEREQCIELLKAMLEIDGDMRITPSEVLAHPFIDNASQGHHSSYFQTGINEKPRHLVLESSTEHLDCELPATTLEDEDTTSSTQTPTCRPSTTVASPIVIDVRPASAENTLVPENESELESTSVLFEMNGTSGGLVNLEVEDWENEDFQCEPPASALKDDVTDIQPDHCSPFITKMSSRVIEVQPAKAENILQMEDQEDAVSLQAEKKSGSFVEDTEDDKLASKSEDTTCGDSGTERRKKKKKNIFRRVLSWVRKNMKSCICSNDDKEDEK